jgi:hypothetical protein
MNVMLHNINSDAALSTNGCYACTYACLHIRCPELPTLKVHACLPQGLCLPPSTTGPCPPATRMCGRPASSCEVRAIAHGAGQTCLHHWLTAWMPCSLRHGNCSTNSPLAWVQTLLGLWRMEQAQPL